MYLESLDKIIKRIIFSRFLVDLIEMNGIQY